MNYIISLLFIVFVTSLTAQDSCVFNLSFIDKKTGDFIPNVVVKLNLSDSKFELLSGDFKGNLSKNVICGFQIDIFYSHPMYETGSISKKIVAGRSDTMNIQFLLVSSRVQNVGEVIAKPTGVPTVVYGSERLSVADFEIQKDGTFILLAYSKRLNKGNELLLFDGQKVSYSFSVPGVAQQLIRDFRGNTHVVCEDNVFGVLKRKNKIELAQIEKEYFIKYLLPIIDSNKTKLYFSNFNKDYPAFDYFAFDQDDSVYTKITSVKDDLMMELYRSEYKWVDVRTKIWAKYKEIETGIDAEIWVGANYFTQSIYYKELYAPLFQRNDSIFVFDYYKDRLGIYNQFGDSLTTVPIYHHYQSKSTGWKSNLIQDQVTGEIYALFEKDGYSYLGLVNTQTGNIDGRIKLEYKYVDKIAVNDGFVYYIYRPYESIQKKYLYNEKLR